MDNFFLNEIFLSNQSIPFFLPRYSSFGSIFPIETLKWNKFIKIKIINNKKSLSLALSLSHLCMLNGPFFNKSFYSNNYLELQVFFFFFGANQTAKNIFLGSQPNTRE